MAREFFLVAAQAKSVFIPLIEDSILSRLYPHTVKLYAQDIADQTVWEWLLDHDYLHWRGYFFYFKNESIAKEFETFVGRHFVEKLLTDT